MARPVTSAGESRDVEMAVEAGSSRPADIAEGDEAGTSAQASPWGVCKPCLEDTLGVILFLRLPWITGQAGAVQATFIVLLSVAVTTLTALSISAIATNERIKARGLFWVITRNLGKEVGAAVGVLLYLGVVVACALYALGAVAAFQKPFGVENQFGFDTQVEALGVLLLLALVAALGDRYMRIAAHLFLGAVLLSILSFLVGIVIFAAGGALNGAASLDAADRETWGSVHSSYEKDAETGLTPSFFSLLALFFPSLTGITAGLNRSQSRDVGHSVPQGTLAAIATGSVVFLSTVWLFGASVSSDALKANKLAMAAAAWPHPVLVNAGILVIAVGAVLQCLARAARLLSAIAHEETVPVSTAYAAEPGTTPRRAIGLTWFLASLACLSGHLDYLAPIVSMLFLLAFAIINFACYVLIVLRQPSFQPTWPYFHWASALAGSMTAVVLMMGISWYWGLAAAFLTATLYVYVSFSDAAFGWGNVRDGVRFKVARDALLAMREQEELHPQKWVPQLLVVVELDEDTGAPVPAQASLLDLAAQLKKERGLTVASGMLRGSDLQALGPRMQALKKQLQRRSEEHGMRGMTTVGTAASYQGGVWSAVQHSGLGPMQANVVMLPWLAGGAERWREDAEVAEDYIHTLRGVTAADRSLVVVKLAEGARMPGPGEREQGTIDVWWIAHDLSLIFFLARQLLRHRAWRRCKLRLFTVASDVGSGLTLERSLSDHLDVLQIDADVNVVTMEPQEMLDWRAISQRTLDNKTRDQLLRELGQEDSTLTMVAQGDVRRRGGSSTRAVGKAALSSLFGEAEEEEAEAEVEAQAEAERDVGQEVETTGTVQTRERGGEHGEGREDVTASEEVQYASVKGAAVDGGDEGGAAGEEKEEGGVDGASSGPTTAERLRMAAKMNATICAQSKDARLVVMNVPFGRDIAGQRIVEHIEMLTEGIDRALLVRGCGREVVTDL